MFKRFFLKLSILFFLILVAAGVYGYFWVKNLTPEKLLQSSFVQDQVKEKLGDENTELFNLLPRFLGFTQPVNYLLLFQNNTEIRPSGGFLGVYAVVRVDKGKMEVLKVEGTEILDRNTPEDWKPTPPKVISEHLDVDRWYFRDANWSPDYVESVKNVLKLYKGEEGLLADEINAVVAITPTVLEKFIEKIGPVVVQDIEFTAENVTEKLEYEVEYGYDDKGISFHERKQIIEPFMLELLSRLKINSLTKIQDYFEIIEDLTKEKHILMYSFDEDTQKEFDDRGWSGRVEKTEGDYLMWVDANLAALKTDHAMERVLSYSFEPREDGGILATAEMEYIHNGSFDWRTSRYRTYARIYVPVGSEFIDSAGSMAWDRTDKLGTIDQGEELGKQWFGAFISIEPGKTGKLSFSYLLPESVSKQIENGSYTLFVQKQAGTIDHGLTLGLKFGNNIVAASPEEIELEWGDSVYKRSDDLRVDREFEVIL
ncbi:MAG: DUF4012 domain-containing protein [Candidatus Magasanikbacteria bacterium]|jgi:hypothetical protein|nr:DUF4012 domain-containing protein [Candidatus Magasanikbacteria bacterium]MBT4314485.1 DUF4012 domain-containing protein [Candidatus Magasanikbacteria bacterium]MBT4547309.1 DUF4012 domain-containing protein [Candidatus Magasanikbacteria bacterium]MBT6818922.1 DUF4012 domain-containing protein [Candidatus Magasanikbacteria bacterium]